MYRARSSPAAWNTGNACSTSAASFSVAPSGSTLRRTTPAWILPQSSPIRSPARRGTLGDGICAPERIVAPARPEQGFAELDFEGEVELGRRYERGGALEEAHGGAVVLAKIRAEAGGGQAPPRRRGQDRRRRAYPSSSR